MQNLLFVQVASVARSGMSRTLRFYNLDRNSGRLNYCTCYIAENLKTKCFDNSHSQKVIRVHGCGMDMVIATLEKLKNPSNRYIDPSKPFDLDLGWGIQSFDSYQVI